MELFEKPIGNHTAYYSTFCIVCKSSQELKRCSKCKMIGYCCPEHQRMHWPKHKQICTAIFKARTVGGIMLPGHDNKSRLVNDGYYPQNVWTEQISALMSVIEMSMQRQLDNDERSMVLFPRSCRVCRDMDHNKLSPCVICSSVSYCSETHRDKDLARHTKDCIHLAFSFQIAQFLNKTDISKLELADLYLPLRIKYRRLPVNIHSYMRPQNIECNSKKETILRTIAFGGHSYPLTLLYAMEKIGFPNNKKTLVVHVVGPNQEECLQFLCWEDLLHWLPALKVLKLILVGPNASKFFDSQLAPICDKCKDLKKSLRLTVNTMLYHEYFRSDSYIPPDLVVAFNCGFSELEGASNDTWAASLPMLANPWLVFTSFNVQDAERDVQCMKNACKKKGKVVFEILENPFRGIYPYRECEFDTVFFQNYYLTVLKME